MKKALALALTIIMVSAPVSAAPTTDGECKDLYPLTGIVTEVEHMEDTDLITMTTANGNQFSWYTDSTDDWFINDLASCIQMIVLIYSRKRRRQRNSSIFIFRLTAEMKSVVKSSQ